MSALIISHCLWLPFSLLLKFNPRERIIQSPSKIALLYFPCSQLTRGEPVLGAADGGVRFCRGVNGPVLRRSIRGRSGRVARHTRQGEIMAAAGWSLTISESRAAA